MSQPNDNVLYIPIQINGGVKVPDDLLERELFIKNGELHVGTGNGKEMIILGNVVPGAILTDIKLSKSLFIDTSEKDLEKGNGMILTKDEFDANKKAFEKEGRLIFIDEGQY